MKLYRFAYSSYARKAQMVLDLLGLSYETVEVPFGDRTDLVRVTGGYVQVPVLEDDGKVIVDSRAICEYLLHGERAARLVPSPWEGPIWAYADWCDGPLEDVLFRLSSPNLRQKVFDRAADRALFTFIKERKFGRGCVDEWQRTADELASRGRALLAPTARTLSQQPFLFGAQPTLADAALYGQCLMLRMADPQLPATLAPGLSEWMARVEAAAHRK